MTLAEYADFICQKVGQTDDVSVGVCKQLLNTRYKMIWDAFLWKNSLGLITATTTAGSPWIVFDDPNMERIEKLKITDSTIPVLEPGTVFDLDNNLFNSTAGTPSAFMTMPPVALADVPSDLDAGSTMILINDGLPVEDGVLVFERPPDLGGGVEQRALVLTGATNTITGVMFPLRFDVPISSQSAYLVSFAGSFDEHAYFNTFPRIKMLQPPGTAQTVLALGKRKCLGFTDQAGTLIDNMGTLLTNVDNALIAFAQGDMLERQRQYSKAAAKAEEGKAQLKIMLDLETNQTAFENRIIPAYTGGEPWGWGYGDFGSLSKNVW